jgi:hypothetical protein
MEWFNRMTMEWSNEVFFGFWVIIFPMLGSLVVGFGMGIFNSLFKKEESMIWKK